MYVYVCVCVYVCVLVVTLVVMVVGVVVVVAKSLAVAEVKTGKASRGVGGNIKQGSKGVWSPALAKQF